jgi:hypothetical protein
VASVSRRTSLLKRKSVSSTEKTGRVAQCDVPRAVAKPFAEVGTKSLEVFSVAMRFSMNEVFPPVRMVTVAAAVPGSFLRLPRANRMVALATSHFVNGARSIVVLNADHHDRPSVVFAENWRDPGLCLSYNANLTFELCVDDDAIDFEHNWWRSSGTMICIGGDLYLQATPFNNMSFGQYQINVRDGSIREEPIPTGACFFRSWKLWLRDANPERKLLLFDFDLAAPKTRA